MGGHIGDRMLPMPTQALPECYETDYAGLVDTYVITEWEERLHEIP